VLPSDPSLVDLVWATDAIGTFLMATRFTYFTRPDGPPIYVNVDNVVTFSKAQGDIKGETVLHFTNGQFAGVNETVERVLAILRANEQS
jgi:hypothetical protein